MPFLDIIYGQGPGRNTPVIFEGVEWEGDKISKVLIMGRGCECHGWYTHFTSDHMFTEVDLLHISKSSSLESDQGGS